MSQDQTSPYRTALTSNSTGSAPQRSITVLIPAAIVLLTLGFMFAESPANSRMKIGYVNSSTILQLLPAAQKVQSQLDTLVQDWSDTIDQMSKKYQAKINDFQRQSSLMTAEAKQREQHEITDLQQEIVAYRQDRVGQGGELAKIRDQLLKPIRSKIMKAIAHVARSHRMQYVLDSSHQAAVLLFEDPRYDLTYEVLDRLTR